MGFQGADPRLFEALAKQNPDACQPLDEELALAAADSWHS